MSLSYLLLNLSTYSKFNLIHPFSFGLKKNKTKITVATLTILIVICLFPYSCTEVQPCTSLFQNQNFNKVFKNYISHSYL